MLQSTDPERLNYKEGPRGDARISLGTGHRGNLLGGLGESGHENLRDQVVGVSGEGEY